MGRVSRIVAALVVVLLCGSVALPGAVAGAAEAPAPNQTPNQTANPETGTTAWSVRPTPSAATPDRPNFSFDVKPGGGVTDSIRVRNFGAAPLTFRIYASDAFNTKAGALDLLAGDKKPKDIGAWIFLGIDTIVVGEHAVLDVPFRLAVPKGAAPGDHTGGIVMSLVTASTDAEGQPVRVDRRLGSRVYARVDGPTRPGLAVTRTTASYDGTLNPLGSGSMKVSYTVKNTGNVRVKAHQRIEMKGPLGVGGTAARFPDIPEVLPGNSLSFVALVPGVRPTVRAEVVVHATPFASRDGETFPSEPDEATGRASMWAVPWGLLALVLIVVGGVVGFIRLRKRRRRQVEAEVDRAVAAALTERDSPAPATASAGSTTGAGSTSAEA